MGAIKRKAQSVKLKTKGGFGRIGVLMGGPSAERKVSLKSGQAVCDNLRQLKVDVVSIDITTDNVRQNTRLLKSKKIDCAFIALHGRFGEDGQIQEILDGLKIPYTGSGVLASRLAMDKISSLNIFQMYGLKVPRHKAMDIASYDAHWRLSNKFDTTPLANPTRKGGDKGGFSIPPWCTPGFSPGDGLHFPLVVKPAASGSSIGLSIVDNPRGLERAVEAAFSFDKRIIIQEYIAGKEITVGILEERALPVIEIAPKKRFFDFEAKYSQGMTDYIVPARLECPVAKAVRDTALSAHRLLGCYGCSRVDMIIKDKTPFVLEINTIPGLTETSLLPRAARAAGIDFGGLCLKLIALAYEKQKDGLLRARNPHI